MCVACDIPRIDQSMYTQSRRLVFRQDHVGGLCGCCNFEYWQEDT